MGMPLVKPVVVSHSYPVKHIVHNAIILEDEIRISSSLVANVLKNAHTIIPFVCSIGNDLEKLARQTSSEDPVLSMALDALGSAAVEQLIMEVCRRYELEASERSEFVSQPTRTRVGRLECAGRSAIDIQTGGCSQCWDLLI